MDVLEVMAEVASELSMAATYRGEGCWWNEGDDGIMDRAIEARAAVAELIEAVDEYRSHIASFKESASPFALAQCRLDCALSRVRGAE